MEKDIRIIEMMDKLNDTLNQIEILFSNKGIPETVEAELMKKFINIVNLQYYIATKYFRYIVGESVGEKYGTGTSKM